VILYIDPSFNTCGFATFDDKHKPLGCWQKTFTGKFTQRIDEIVKYFSDLFLSDLPSLQYDAVVMEMPDVWTRKTPQGRSKNVTSIRKLDYAIGTIYAVSKLSGVKCYLVPVRIWKGKMPKSFSKARARREFGKKVPEHASDAVDLGLMVSTFLKGGVMLEKLLGNVEILKQRRRIPNVKNRKA
jgi:hypothetical protein